MRSKRWIWKFGQFKKSVAQKTSQNYWNRGNNLLRKQQRFNSNNSERDLSLDRLDEKYPSMNSSHCYNLGEVLCLTAIQFLLSLSLTWLWQRKVTGKRILSLLYQYEGIVQLFGEEILMLSPKTSPLKAFFLKNKKNKEIHKPAHATIGHLDRFGIRFCSQLPWNPIIIFSY